MKLRNKYENVFKEMCWNDAYMILGMEDQYVGNCHNNATHISSVVFKHSRVDLYRGITSMCGLLVIKLKL